MQLGGENRPVPGELVVLAEQLLDHHLEPVTRLKVGVEVDVAREDSRERERQVDRFAGLIQRGHERIGVGTNRTSNGDDARRLLDWEDLRNELRDSRIFRAGDLQQPIAIDLVLEPAQRAIERAGKTVRLIDAHTPEIEYR